MLEFLKVFEEVTTLQYRIHIDVDNLFFYTILENYLNYSLLHNQYRHTSINRKILNEERNS